MGFNELWKNESLSMLYLSYLVLVKNKYDHGGFKHIERLFVFSINL